MPLRIGGLATGMDTDMLVKQLMQAKRIPVDRLEAKKTIKEWTRDSYREMNTLLDQLRREAGMIKTAATISAKKAAVSDETIATAQAGATAVAGTYTLKINQTATSASVMSSPLGVTSTQQLTASDLVLNVTGEKGSKAVTIKAGSTIDAVVTTINADTTATGVRAMYDKATDRMYFTSSTTGEPAFVSVTGADAAADTFLTGTLKFAAPTATNVETGTKAFTNTTTAINSSLAGSVDFTVNGATLTIDKTTTVASLQEQLNKAGLSPNVSLSLNASGQVQLQSTGAITLAEGSGGLSELGLTTPTSSTASGVFAQGTNAQVEFNGVPGVVEFRNNTFTLNNIAFTAKKADPATTLTVNVNSDSTAVYDSIKKFVDKYNEVIEKVYSKTHEKYNRSYQPLTAEQKEAMKEDEVKRWEEKAKEGLLRNDTLLNRTLNEFRQSISAPVTGLGAPNTLEAIGIKTSSDFSENGKLYIDDYKVKQALADNPDAVLALFTQPAPDDSTVPAGTTAEKYAYKMERSGVGVRMYEALNIAINGLSDKAGGLLVKNNNNQIGKEIQELDDRIYKANSRMANYEQQYYSQFARLETAMNKMNQQSAWLSQQFGSMGG